MITYTYTFALPTSEAEIEKAVQDFRRLLTQKAKKMRTMSERFGAYTHLLNLARLVPSVVNTDRVAKTTSLAYGYSQDELWLEKFDEYGTTAKDCGCPDHVQSGRTVMCKHMVAYNIMFAE